MSACSLQNIVKRYCSNYINISHVIMFVCFYILLCATRFDEIQIYIIVVIIIFVNDVWLWNNSHHCVTAVKFNRVHFSTSWNDIAQTVYVYTPLLTYYFSLVRIVFLLCAIRFGEIKIHIVAVKPSHITFARYHCILQATPFESRETTARRVLAYISARTGLYHRRLNELGGHVLRRCMGKRIFFRIHGDCPVGQIVLCNEPSEYRFHSVVSRSICKCTFLPAVYVKIYDLTRIAYVKGLW